MVAASTLLLPGADARRAPARVASGSPRWWRGLLLAALLGGSGGAGVRGCHYGEGVRSDCEHNDTAPEGTRFRVEVLEELPDSDGCLALQPGSIFFLTAGVTVEWKETCSYTVGSGPPEGLETGYEYADCQEGAMLGARCNVAYRELCPEVREPGYVYFVLRSTNESLLDAGPSEGEFYVWDAVPPECASRAGCDDKYRIRISRVMEE